jgi:hypothetical protein
MDSGNYKEIFTINSHNFVKIKQYLVDKTDKDGKIPCKEMIMKRWPAVLFCIAFFLILFGCESRNRQLVLEKISKSGSSEENPAAVTRMGSQLRDSSLSPGAFEKPNGGYTVAECYERSNKLDKKKVLIRGKVVKVNPEIMDKNWIHIQDGTGDETSFDLTVTTKQMAEVGDIVLVEGKLFKDRNVGIEIIYPVIIEEARITVE